MIVRLGRRWNVALVALFLMQLMKSPPPIDAQETANGPLSVETAVQLVLDSDPGIRRSRIRTLQARGGYGLALAGTRPGAELSVRPYSYDQRRLAVTHSTGIGLRVQQPLPTSGVLTAGIDHTIRRIEPETGLFEWRQVPELSFGWRQPLMAGEQFIGTRVFRAGLRDAEIDYMQAELTHDATRNEAVREALELFVQVGNLRRSADLLEETIALLRRQLESAELDRQQGLISDTTLLALRITLNNRREALFSTRLQLVQVEQMLARSIGVDSIGDMELAELPRTPSRPMPGDLIDAIRENPRLRVGELAVEQAEQRSVMNTRVDRPVVDLFARVQPVYPAVRDDTESFSDSFGDLFGGEAGIDMTLGLTVTIPLLTDRRREYRDRIDELTRRDAGVARDDTQQMLINGLRTLLTNRRFLEERLDLLEIDLDYERRRTESERSLLESGVSTELRVREVELDLRSRRNEALRVEAELLLNSVDILNLLGEDIADVFSR